MDATEYGLSTIYQGIAYLFGGIDGYSIQKINGCSLVTVSTQLIRSIDVYGSFVSIEGQGVYTCFRSNSYNWCQLYDGSSVRMIDYLAARDKEKCCMASYDGKPAAIGGDGGRMVEVLNSNGWYDLGEHPRDTRYAGCLTLDNSRKMVTIGGYDGDDMEYVYIYLNNEWNYHGTLKLSHQFNTLLVVDDFIISAPGMIDSDNAIERIKITDEGFTSEIIARREYVTDVYRPMLFLTERNQCLA